MHGPFLDVDASGYPFIRRYFGHQLSDPNGKVAVHRLMLWATIGDGEQRCALCECRLQWFPEEGSFVPPIIVDHIDHDKTNNDPSNLRPLCQRCNVWHG